jgi:hypothetical protein
MAAGDHAPDVLVNRKARMGRNPATGETIKIKAKRVVKFRVAKVCKDAILGITFCMPHETRLPPDMVCIGGLFLTLRGGKGRHSGQGAGYVQESRVDFVWLSVA